MKFLLVSFFITIVSLFFSSSINAQSFSESANPVIWRTAYNEFSSSDFYIQIGGKRLIGAGNVDVSSDPGIDKTTLELTWKENGVEARLYFYFEKIEKGMWQLYDLRSYNLNGTDWIYYQTVDTNGNPVKSLIGQRDYSNERIFLAKDGSAKIYCKDCSITAFIDNIPPPSVQGYSIDFRIGIPQSETITITNDPSTGYGVNAVLFDSSRNVVKEQSVFSYEWRTDNNSVLTILPQSVPYPDGNCAYGILAPCPNFNLQIQGKIPGIARIYLDVIRQSDKAVIASNSFPVRVVESNQLTSPVISITPLIQPTTIASDDMTVKLKELQGEVGVLRKKVQEQQDQINILQKIIQSIQDFISRLFGHSS